MPLAIRDHLDNIGVVWDELGTLNQKMDYYPFDPEIKHKRLEIRLFVLFL